MKSADSLTLPANDNYTPNALNQLTNVDGSMRTHDDDGNLLEDGTRLYVWDAENRLIEVKEKATSNVIAEYAYDYKSRRVEKTESGVTTSYLYEGWNPIAEYTGNVLTKSYTWGMDLSGSMQGAGGVGGLLAVNDGASSYYPTYDGNGNVSEYVDATGAVVAHYEYDAFGRTVAESGAKAADFSHRFSTKPKENFGEFYYYGYRFYDAGLGRWLNRDPIEERGGVNLYGFSFNNPISMHDLLGMSPSCDCCVSERNHVTNMALHVGNAQLDYNQSQYAVVGAEYAYDSAVAMENVAEATFYRDSAALTLAVATTATVCFFDRSTVGCKAAIAASTLAGAATFASKNAWDSAIAAIPIARNMRASARTNRDSRKAFVQTAKTQYNLAVNALTSCLQGRTSCCLKQCSN